ncbi:MAG: hypothetical protein N2512_01815, partial [Armatimonadetes bacterium]|nr:hypothetical protein [Armatimonadota bacterium]
SEKARQLVGATLLAVSLAAGLSCCHAVAQGTTGTEAEAVPGWLARLREAIPLYGHRNWICVVDSAYPAQSREAIETIYVGGDQLDLVRLVLDELARARHVRPIIYCDKELRFVPERDAAGIEAYRRELAGLLGSREVKELPHEEIIKLLDTAAQTFRVLILKTDLTLPYTSVFINLDCGYWSPEAEKRLREAMKKAR